MMLAVAYVDLALNVELVDNINEIALKAVQNI